MLITYFYKRNNNDGFNRLNEELLTEKIILKSLIKFYCIENKRTLFYRKRKIFQINNAKYEGKNCEILSPLFNFSKLC